MQTISTFPFIIPRLIHSWPVSIDQIWRTFADISTIDVSRVDIDIKSDTQN